MSKIVMVVDDEEDFLYEVRKMLEREEYSVITATRGEEALKILKDSKPDLILLDVMMPGMDGWNLAKRIREIDGLEEATIAMLTVKNTLDDKIMSLEDSQAAWHISKPIEMNKFLDTVKWLIENPPIRED